MILSVAHKFIFVRGRKVGGTSVEIALSTLCGPDDIVPPLVARDERTRQALNGRCGNYSEPAWIEAAYTALVAQSPPDQLHLLKTPVGPYSAHTSLSEILARYPGSVEGFRVLCLARCPYARVLSALNMAGAFDTYRRGGAMEGGHEGWERAFDQALETGGLQRLRNLDIYRDAKGAVTAEVLRYETLQADFDALVASLGVTREIALPHAKKGRMSNTMAPLDNLRRDQIDAINAIFSEEFDVFGYPRQ